MARNRMIKPEFWEDEKVAKLSFEARLLFLGLLNFADDKGYIRNNPIIIKAKIFPYENFGVDKICNLLQELFNQKMILEQNNIIKIKNFLKHQIIEKPSKKTLENEFENQCEIENSRGIVGEYSPNSNQLFTDKREVKEKLKEVKEKEKEKEKESGDTPQTPFLDSSKNQTAKTANDLTAIPKTYKELIEFLTAKYHYDKKKAELVANRVQSDKFELLPVHCEEFVTMSDTDIVNVFDSMKRLKRLRNVSQRFNFKKAGAV